MFLCRSNSEPWNLKQLAEHLASNLKISFCIILSANLSPQVFCQHIITMIRQDANLFYLYIGASHYLALIILTFRFDFTAFLFETMQ